jgi:type VI secretion system protein ImpL
VQPPAAGAGKSYFLKRVLHDVVFGESGLAGLNPAVERTEILGRLAAYAAFASITGALALVWTASYFSNRELIASTEAKTVDAKRALESVPTLKPGDEAKLVTVLDHLAALRGVARGEDARMLRVGFYQGDKLGAQAERAYRNALAETLLPHLAASLEASLRGAATPGVLDGYVSLHDEGKRDPVIIGKAAAQVWKVPAGAAAQLEVHLREALGVRAVSLPRPRDETLIEDARRRIAGGRTKA